MFRRTTAVLATAAVISLAVMAPARAQTPEDVEAAAATATALQLTLLGQTLAVSQTQAAIGEGGFAAADGAALLLAGTPVPGAAPSVAGGQESNEVCPLELDLDEATDGALSALQLEIACVRTSAKAGEARSASDEVIIRVLAPGGTVVQPILGPVLDAVDQVTDPLVEALAPLLGTVLDVTQIDVASVLDELTTALRNDLFVLAEIVIAPSISEASSTTEGVAAEAGSNAITINVLPGITQMLDVVTDLIDIDNPSSAPLLQVKLGSAHAKVVESGPGEVATAQSAQLLSITADDSLGILQGLTGSLTDVLDLLSITQLSCDGGALADVLCIDLGRVNELDRDELAARNLDFGPTTTGIEASAATIRVLPIAAEALGGDVLGLSLASATAAANTAENPLTAPPIAPPAATPTAPPLPKTGAESALPLTLALLAVGSAGALLVRRTRTI